MNGLVCIEIGRPIKGFTANFTSIGFDTCVSPDVHFQTRGLIESFATHFAFVWLPARMDHLVTGKMLSPTKILPAQLAVIWFLPRVNSSVTNQISGLTEGSIAKLTLKGLLSSVNSHVSA